MRRLRRGGLLLLTALVATACTGGGTTPSSSASSMSRLARIYLDSALDLMHDHALNRSHLDWPKIRRQAYQNAAGALRATDVYPVIELALHELDDNDHSSLIPPTPAGGVSPTGPGQAPAESTISGSITYLSFPGDTSFTNDLNYQREAETAVAGARDRSTCGWILDLRDNTGGNLWPMLIGVQPLLGTGDVGYFVPPGNPREPVTVTPTAAGYSGRIEAKATRTHADASNAPVAVVTGPHTASSGEFVAIAFRGRARASSFGLPTDGRPTANEPYPLSDGATLNLTVGRDADRTMHVYPDSPISPEHAAPGSSTAATSVGTDPAIHAATAWLRDQHPSGCV